MSLTVLFIALLHGVPVGIANLVWGKHIGFITALIMSVIAVASGGSQYAGADILIIWLIFFLV
ncbi:hypothetical protein [Haliea sp.]|uniref:hypothetical protein n=1 Tax=Haliea sp. TaxID=1932666 RepID=UPI003529492A